MVDSWSLSEEQQQQQTQRRPLATIDTPKTSASKPEDDALIRKRERKRKWAKAKRKRRNTPEDRAKARVHSKKFRERKKAEPGGLEETYRKNRDYKKKQRAMKKQALAAAVMEDLHIAGSAPLVGSADNKSMEEAVEFAQEVVEQLFPLVENEKDYDNKEEEEKEEDDGEDDDDEDNKLEQQSSVCSNSDDDSTIQQLQTTSTGKAQAKRPFPPSQEKESLAVKVTGKSGQSKTTTMTQQAEHTIKRHKSNSCSSSGTSHVDEHDDTHWDEYYYQLAFFKATEGHANVPEDYVCKDNYRGKKDMEFHLGKWVHLQRAELSVYLRVENENEQVSEHFKLRIQKLKSIGFEFDDGWDEYYVRLVFFKATQEHTKVPLDYVCKEKDQLPLGKWIALQRRELSAHLREGKIIPSYVQRRIEKLQSIGFKVNDSHGDQHQYHHQQQEQQADSPKEEQPQQQSNQKHLGWEGHYKLLQAFQSRHQHLRIPVKYETPDGIKLGSWVAKQRANFAKKVRLDKTNTKTIISQERIDLLNAISFPWKVNHGRPGHSWHLK